MQAQQSSSSQIIQYTMSKIEKSFLEIGYQIESSFAEIDKFIDSIFLIPFKYVTHKIESKLELPKFPEFSISEFDSAQQILESLKPLVNKIIKNRIEIKEQNNIQYFGIINSKNTHHMRYYINEIQKKLYFIVKNQISYLLNQRKLVFFQFLPRYLIILQYQAKEIYDLQQNSFIKLLNEFTR
ncbi:unnamed protein product [Paramecium primaurelia]|uniref:Uncharacterized protein n=1 Tax=Paramecium primaurelia TaxID=5886 RepID=A0A8S1QTB2_PARPR|nr:unnamed protein product [Paramecium primaurelia]